MKSKNQSDDKTVSMFILNDCDADVRVLKLANTLVKNNYKVQIVATHVNKKLPKAETLQNGVKMKRIHVMKIPILIYLEFWLKAILYFKNQKVGTYICHDLNTLPIGGFMKRKHKNSRLVYDTHEFFPSMVEESMGRFVFWIYASIEKPLIKMPNFITTISESMAIYLRIYYNLKQPIDYIFNAPNETISNFPVIPIERNSSEVLFTLVGTVSALNRGFELLPDFAKHLKKIRRESDPEIRVIVLGDGGYRKKIQKRLKEDGHDDLIKFLGHHPYNTAMAMSKSCDVGLILTQATSLNNLYSGPNRIFDYLGNELPILATDLYEFKKIAIKEGCGWIVPSGNAEALAEIVLEVARDRNEILEKKKNIKSLFVQKYTWERMENKILQLYK
jgi:glycosyltransferase involved in cell wall biosynthesis